jgi:hypothetical protein
MSGDLDLPAKGIALLAFVIAFYALAARERKTPYITGAIYSIATLVLLALLLDLLGFILAPNYPHIGSPLRLFAQALLLGGVVFVTYNVLQVRGRHVYFRDDWFFFRNMNIVRRFKQWKRRNDAFPYEHTAPSLPENLLTAMGTVPNIAKDTLELAAKRSNPGEKVKLSLSGVYHARTPGAADKFLMALAGAFLSCDCPIEYITCIRHPIEFLAELRKHVEGSLKRDWKDVGSRLVVVDAFTPHFGFTDSIHSKYANFIRNDMGVHFISSRSTFAGIHTATADGFNWIKKKSREARPPTLVIFEGCHALVDLESVEQYHIFVRHVFPSERIWGGMFTLFIESSVPAAEADLLRGYADIFVEEDSPGPKKGTEDAARS